MEDLIELVLERLPAVLDAVRVELSDDFPMDLFLAIQKGMQVSAARLRRMPSNN